MTPVQYHDESEILELVRQFEAKTLPAERWTHAAHLTVCAVYLLENTPDEAICFLRSNIIAYRLARGLENSPTEGYHETLTLFWIWLVMVWLGENARGRTLLNVVNDLISSELTRSDAAFRYYSRELVLSTRARARWVEPDLRELELN